MRKGIIMAFACAAMIVAMPFSVKAEEGYRIHGDTMQQNAGEMKNEAFYYETGIIENQNYYYKFKTGSEEGIYLLSLASVVKSATSNGQVTVTVVDRYGSAVDSASAGGPGANYRTSNGVRTSDILMPISGLAKNEYYYVCVNSNDGDPAHEIDITTRISVAYISFLPADGFQMKNSGNTLDFSWNNVQKANKYDSLKSFDGFQLELFSGNSTRIKYLGNGGLKSCSISGSDSDLVALGYPAKSVRIRLGCLQTYRSVFEDSYSVTKCIYSDKVYHTEVVKKAAQSDVSGLKYKITKVKGDGTGTVTVLGFADKKKAAKKVTIASNVTIKGTSYRVTAIASKAFAGNKKITTVDIGPNVTNIGANAFDNCTGLKNITIRSTNLKKVGKGAFTRIYNKAKFKSPTKALNKKNKKLLKNKSVSGAKYTVG
ncbi:leucine-rich repeat protein [Butyrivibrio sp. WCD3002]|uniref:leucine-rich repeat protein n=1 Tax=Butyrivibrio sp. WCD3002 TaxID=1280676 RepID=UPI0004236E0E|nr:leucine-rich repeat protein [Butyrivibrio sp. WCD3002]